MDKNNKKILNYFNVKSERRKKAIILMKKAQNKQKK